LRYFQLLEREIKAAPMAVELPPLRQSRPAIARAWRGLMAAVVAMAVGWGGIVLAANNSVQGAKKEEGGFDGDAPTAILIEASSGSVLFEKNADELRAPSSMMKLMTAEVVFHAVKQGEVKLTDEYRVSENAWRKGGAPSGGSTMFAAIHSKISVDDLLHGAIIQSGNDACMVLAEGIAGNERTFAADMMTKRARELGLTQSTFANSNGLPDPGNKMTVRELAKLARYVIQTYPDFYKLFGEREFTWNKIRQQNRNPLLTSLEGADGLKTGFTKEGGYGMIGSAVQNGMRLIVVVNGLDDPDDRASEAKKMLEWGFRNFEARTLFAAQQPVGYAKVFGGENRSVKLASPQPIKVMVQKNGTDKLIARVVYNGPVRAPIEAGQPVGLVRVWRGANMAMEAPVYAAESVGQGSTMRRAIDGASELVIGVFRAGAEKL
jgi:serine-type D-Ala-D-Ala carboxypeptidase (penicillin-binding protein 5/6)